ncbi:unnamed protein product [Rhodiola kirilowii]
MLQENLELCGHVKRYESMHIYRQQGYKLQGGGALEALKPY